MSGTVRNFPRPRSGNVTPFIATQAMSVLDAVYHTVHAYPGGAPALAARMQTRDKFGDLIPMSANTLQHKVDPNCHTHKASVEEARDIMVLSQDFRILYALAANTNHVAIRVSADCSGITIEKVGVAAKEFGDLVEAVTKAGSKSSAKGSCVTPNEMAKIEREAAELIGALNGLVGSMRAQMVEGR